MKTMKIMWQGCAGALLMAAIVSIGALGASSCSSTSLSKTVDPDKLKEMSRQGQLWIFDAENEIVVALDKLDEAKDALAAIRRRLQAAERILEAAEKRNNRSGVEMVEQWLKYLKSTEEWAKARTENSRLGVVVAQAAVELAKAQVVNNEDLLGGKDFSIKVYQEQYTRLKNAFEEEEKLVGNLRKVAREKEAQWWILRQRFVAQTGTMTVGSGLSRTVRARREINRLTAGLSWPPRGLRPRSFPQRTASTLWSVTPGALAICLS